MIAIATNEPHEIDVKCQQEHWNFELNWYLQLLAPKSKTKLEKPHKSEKVSNMIKTLKPLLHSWQHLYEDDNNYVKKPSNSVWNAKLAEQIRKKIISSSLAAALLFCMTVG